MEKKYFLAVPVLFILFSILFPVRSGTDFHFEDIKTVSEPIFSDSSASNFPCFPGKECTAYVNSGSLSVIGFLDGELLVKNSDSSCKNLVFENKSRIKTVYSVAISKDAEYIAAIVGADPKYLFIFKEKKGTWTLLRQDKLCSDERRSVYLEFSGDVLLYEMAGKIASYNMHDASCAVMNIGEDIRTVASDPEKDYFWVLSKHNLYAFKYNGKRISMMPYNSYGKILKQSGDIVTLDIDGKLYSTRLVEGK